MLAILRCYGNEAKKAAADLRQLFCANPCLLIPSEFGDSFLDTAFYLRLRLAVPANYCTLPSREHGDLLDAVPTGDGVFVRSR